jgi:transcriptional regulator with PAS, ATPase and Fis domain
MQHYDWIQEFSGSITVTDTEGKILSMNAAAVETFKKDGGDKLIGKNLMDCHPEAAQAKIKTIMETKKLNIYTIEKAGKKKLVYQAPWYKDGRYSGLVELVFEIPAVLPHFIRD